MTIARTTDNVDLTQTGDYIAKDSVSDGALKKLDAEIDYIYTHLNNTIKNNAGTSEPASPVEGQIWYDSSVGYHKKYSGSAWSALSSAAGISNVVEDTSPSLGGNLDLNQFDIVLDRGPDANGAHNGIAESWTAGENLSFSEVCYLKSDGKMWKCDADAEATSKGLIRMAMANITAEDAGTFLALGFVRNDSWDWTTVGEELYISVTPGGPTETAPSGDGDIKRILGHAVSADIMFFNPSQTYIEIEA